MNSTIGIIGIGTMGQNLSFNFMDHGYSVSIYDVNTNQVDRTLQATKSDLLTARYDLEQFIKSLSKPRVVLIMVRAGKVTDTVLSELQPFLEEGDVVIDGGNANFQDTIRRVNEFQENGIHYIGAGISGGAKGARHGPSIMPGGNEEGWSIVQNLLQTIAAKTESGEPCCKWVGPDGAGHYVKTIHNGIEYGDMELIAEAYDILNQLGGFQPYELTDIFSQWNDGILRSYLIEITSDILSKTDETTGQPLVNLILDHAGQKGTGKWTVHSALDLGLPSTIIASAVFQRFLSSQKSERLIAADQLSKSIDRKITLPSNFVDIVKNGLYVAKVLSYAQGFTLLKHASTHYGWDLNLANIAQIWRNGCIIRSDFLLDIQKAFSNDPSLENLILSSFFTDQIRDKIDYLRKLVKLCVDAGISSPGFNAAISYYDGYSSSVLPANLIQAQRDYFGSHGYIRTDIDSDQSFTTEWDKS